MRSSYRAVVPCYASLRTDVFYFFVFRVRQRKRSVFIWCHGGHIVVPKQRNGGVWCTKPILRELNYFFWKHFLLFQRTWPLVTWVKTLYRRRLHAGYVVHVFSTSFRWLNQQPIEMQGLSGNRRMCNLTTPLNRSCSLIGWCHCITFNKRIWRLQN